MCLQRLVGTFLSVQQVVYSTLERNQQGDETQTHTHKHIHSVQVSDKFIKVVPVGRCAKMFQFIVNIFIVLGALGPFVGPNLSNKSFKLQLNSKTN